MTDADANVQETTETQALPYTGEDNSGGKGGNPFRSGPKPPPKPKTGIFDVDNVEDEPDDEPVDVKVEVKAEETAKPVDKTTSLDDIEDVALLRKLVKDTRREAAKARTDKQAELKEFAAWKDSQKTETERAIEQARERAEAAEARADKLLIENLQREFNISDDLVEFISGSTEGEMRAKAEKLKGTSVKDAAPAPVAEPVVSALQPEKPAGPGLLGGTRGTPVNKTETTNDWFTKLMQES